MEKKNRMLNLICYILCIMIVLVLSLMAFNSLFQIEKEAITPETITYKASISLNGASYVEKEIVSCNLLESGCKIILPNATRNDGEVLGYSLNAKDIKPRYSQGEEISLSGNVTLYVISKKKNYVYIDSDDINYIENDTLECTSYNEDNSCVVTIPFFNKKGYEVLGYSTSVSSLVGFIYPNEEYRISKNVTLYPMYGKSNHLEVINVDKIINFKNSFIEIEDGCDESIYNNYIGYLEEINEYAPFLLIGSKMTFLKDESFNRIWGTNYVGMNYGPKNLRSLDVRCSKTVYNDYYGTMVHEMSHSWDFYYGSKMGKNITSQSDIINLYNKYKNSNNRPFRDYSYSSIYEFQADMVKYYYFKYLQPRIGYERLSYPEDIKRVLEKYICISRNEYDENNCTEV